MTRAEYVSINDLLAEVLSLEAQLRQAQREKVAYVTAALEFDALYEEERSKVRALESTVAELQAALKALARPTPTAYPRLAHGFGVH